jgi:hypothetical protein
MGDMCSFDTVVGNGRYDFAGDARTLKMKTLAWHFAVLSTPTYRMRTKKFPWVSDVQSMKIATRLYLVRKDKRNNIGNVRVT